MSSELVPLVGWISSDITHKTRVVTPLLWLRHERAKTWLEPTLTLAAGGCVLVDLPDRSAKWAQRRGA